MLLRSVGASAVLLEAQVTREPPTRAPLHNPPMPHLLASLILLALTAATPPPPQAQPQPRALAVGSFNIRYANPADGENAWEHRRPLVLDILRAGDLWGLQEALPTQIAEIGRALPEFSIVARSRERDPAQGEACPILYRTERFTLDQATQGTFWLSERPDEPGSRSWDSSLPRIATYARLVERDGSGAYLVVNLHLDHRGATARLEGATLVAKRIAALRNDDPVIILGDFNAGPSSPPLRALLDDATLGLVDAWRVAHPDAPERGTFNGWGEGYAGERIDFVLATKDLAVTACTIDDRRPNGRWPSDHAPVAATLLRRR